MSKLAIIIVNYNAGVWLRRSIKAALAYSDAIVYVVDNNSSDDSVSNAQTALPDEPRLCWQLNQANVGFAAANNQILNDFLSEQSDVEFAVLLNPDCELNESTLGLMLAQFSGQPKLGLAGCLIYNEDNSIQATCRRRFPTPISALSRMLMLHKVFPNNSSFSNFNYGDKPSLAAELEIVEAISGAFMVVRCQAMRDVGVLDEGYFMHCEDLDWCMRFALKQWQVGFVPAASVMHAKGVSSASRPIGVLWTLHKGMNRFFDRFYRQSYVWPVRYLVKLGIYTSFVLRASKSLITGLLFKGHSS